MAENYDELNARLKVLDMVQQYLMEQWRQKTEVEKECAFREERNPKLPSPPTPARVLKVTREMWGFVGFEQERPVVSEHPPDYTTLNGEE